MIRATYGYGAFQSDLPLKIITEDKNSAGAKTIAAKLGEGAATVSLVTSSGSIGIKRAGGAIP